MCEWNPVSSNIPVCDISLMVHVPCSQILIELGNWPGFEIIRESREFVLEVGDFREFNLRVNDSYL